MLSGFHSGKQLLLVMMLAFGTSTHAQQHPPEDSVRYLPKTKLMRATISGYSYDSTLHISKDLLKNGFTVELSDKSFAIVFFLLTYDCKDCDIWEKRIDGNKVTATNAKILNHLSKSDILTFSTFKVKRGNTLLTIPEFSVVVTD